jgi:hypothetical protein
MTRIRPHRAPVQSVRPPSPAGSTVEAALHTANAVSRRTSFEVLAGLLPGFDLRAHSQATDDARMGVSEVTDLDRFVDAGDLLDRALRDYDAVPPRLKTVRRKQSLPPESTMDRLWPAEVGWEPAVGRVPGGRLASIMADGFSLVIDGIDRRDRTLVRFSEHVERAYAAPVNLNAYISLRPEPGFGAHWDYQEVIILQLLGRKSWDVHEPAELSPDPELFGSDTTGRSVWSGEIGPGAALLIPRGWGHMVTGVDELTFHLTVTITRLNLLDVVRRAVPEGLMRPDGNRPVPITGGVGLDALDDVRSVLRASASDAGVAQAIDRFRAALPSRWTQSPLAVADVLTGSRPLEDVWIRAPHPGGCFLAADPEAIDDPVLVLGQRAVSCSEEVLADVAPLLDGRAHQVGRLLEAGPGADHRRQVVLDGLRAGLWEAVDPGAWGVVPASSDAQITP